MLLIISPYLYLSSATLCFNSQKCEWKIMNTEETQRKKSKEENFNLKTRYWFLNFLKNITFTIHATFQYFFKGITCQPSDRERRTTHVFQALISHNNFCGSYFCVKMYTFFLKWILFLRQNVHVFLKWILFLRRNVHVFSI